MEGVDLPILETDYDTNAEIIISIFGNSSFLPHSPMGTMKVELRDLIHMCHNDLVNNEPCKFF